MLIGALNHPQRDPIHEIREFAALGLDFVDLTLEPPAASSWTVDPAAIRAVLEETGMGVVGHTPYYLPIESPFEEVRKGAVAELRRCLKAFSKLGAKAMNVHPGFYAPMHSRSFSVERNLVSLRELQKEARSLGMALMVENAPGHFNTADQLGEILDALPEIGLHLDVGHSNLMVPENTCCEILAVYGERLCHVHLHDNKGGDADLHLPLGVGNIDFPHELAAVKACGYDGTITLEVFADDRAYLTHSRDVLRQIWDSL